MTLKDTIEIATAVVASLGGGGAIVFGLSSYLGKVWADRGLERQRHEYSQMNAALQNQLEIATRRLQVELDSLALVHKLRTQEEIPRLAELWKRMAYVRTCFQGLGIFYVSRENREEVRRSHAQAREQFDSSLNDARTFLAEATLFIPKHICRVSEAALNVATEEQYHFAVHSESLEAKFNDLSDVAAMAIHEERRDYLRLKAEGLKKFTRETDQLETLMRQHLAGEKPSSAGGDAATQG
jgi:hypothetical protein